MTVPPLRFARASDGVKVCYAVLPGQGPPFVFAHAPGPEPLRARLQIRSYAEFCDQFRRGSPMVMYDNRGFGGSDMGDGEASIEQWTLDLAAVVAALGQPVHLIGNFGFASLVSGFAADHPDLVLSLRLASPRLRGIMAKPDFTALLDTNFELAQLYILRLSFDWIDDQRAEDFVEAYVAEKHRGYLWQRASKTLEDTRLADFLPRVTVPVHVVGDDVDEDRQDAIEAAAMLPHAQLTLVPAGPLNAARGAILRDVFDSFWTTVAAEGPPLPPSPSESLSPRETDVLRLVAAGHTNAEVAAGLTLSVRTVERHLENIYRKTGAANRAAASAWATRNGLA